MYIPKDIDECFVELRKVFPGDKLGKFKNTDEDDLAGRYHMGVGAWMRKNWELSGDSPLAKYFKQMGISQDGDMSNIILRSFHRRLNNRDIELDAQVKRYQE